MEDSSAFLRTKQGGGKTRKTGSCLFLRPLPQDKEGGGHEDEDWGLKSHLGAEILDAPFILRCESAGFPHIWIPAWLHKPCWVTGRGGRSPTYCWPHAYTFKLGCYRERVLGSRHFLLQLYLTSFHAQPSPGGRRDWDSLPSLRTKGDLSPS